MTYSNRSLRIVLLLRGGYLDQIVQIYLRVIILRKVTSSVLETEIAEPSRYDYIFDQGSISRDYQRN